MTKQNILDIADLSYGFENPLVKNLNLRLARSESISITGLSGCGKTTLLNLILGFTKPSHGKVHVCANDVHNLGPHALADMRRKHIGVVFQHGELLPGYTAQENVAIPRFLGNRSDKSALTDSAVLLEKLCVPQHTLAENLSGGERSRVALARALINSPSLLLADEPTGSLDPEMRDEALSLLLNTAADLNCATMIVTHDLEVATKTDRTLHLEYLHAEAGAS